MFRFFENLVNPFPPEEPARPPDTLVGFCLHYCRSCWPYLIAVAVLSALIAIVEVSLFSFLGNIVDWLGETDRSVFMETHGTTLIWIGVVMLVILPFFLLLHTLFVHQTLLGNLPMVIRWQAHRYVLGQSQAFFSNEFAGRIGTKVMQTSLAVREAVLKLLDVLVYVLVYFISVLVLIFSIDWRLVIPFVVWFAVYLITVGYFVPRLGEVSRQQADARALMTGRVIDSYTNISTVKLFSHAGREAAYAKEGMGGFMTTVLQQMRLSSLFQMCVEYSGMFLLAATLYTGIALWLAGEVTTGPVAVSMAVILRLQGLSHWIMWETTALFENIGVVRDGMATLSKQRAVEDREDAVALEIKEPSISFERVSFDYVSELPVIKNFELEVKTGEKVGVVGRSGAGKTTLVNLLLRLYDIQEGRILVGGTDIATVTQESLRSHVSVVTQDTSLLHRSVYENIAYGKSDCTFDDVVRAAKQAEAYDFIQNLVDTNGKTAFDAMVGERGVTLSGGQRQRIAIARVFLKDAPILVLDEATSALDSEVEAAIQENLKRLMSGKTVIAIAHRLSTIAQMDRLVVMQEGSIVETGKHQELIESSGLYADLWKRQSGGFIE